MFEVNLFLVAKLTFCQCQTFAYLTYECRHECGHMTFPGTSCNLCNFLVEMSTFNVDFWMQQIWQKSNAKFTGQNTFLEKVTSSS